MPGEEEGEKEEAAGRWVAAVYMRRGTAVARLLAASSIAFGFERIVEDDASVVWWWKGEAAEVAVA